MTSTNNESILPLQDMALPQVPDWFPLAWGWWASLAGIVLIFALLLFYLRWKKKRLAPKKTALHLIPKEKPAAALELVRQVALCYYPREHIAQLTGKDWYIFLDSQVSTPIFEQNYEQWQNGFFAIQDILNSEQLVQDCYQWVEQALPPKKRRA